MKKQKTSPTHKFHHPLNIIAWIVAAISLIGGITLSILAAQPGDQSFEPMPGEAPNNSIEGTRPQNLDRNNEPPINDENFEKQDFNRKNDAAQTSNINIVYAILIVLCILLFSLSLLYLIMSNFNEHFYTTPDKWLILALSTILLTIILSAIGIFCINNHLRSINMSLPDNSNTSREDTEFDKSNITNSNNINLSNQNSDVTITEAGTYTFTGEFQHSIVVDAGDSEVKLVLNGVTINNPSTAAIVGLSAGKITISTAKDSHNTLTDGGNSLYDGCIYSNTELIFEGEGELVVNGTQNEGEGIATETQPITFNSGNYTITSNDDGINAGGDGATITINGGTFYINANGDGIDSNKDAVINAGTIFVIGSDIGGDAGIDTDGGFTINGGTLIALGSDMIETPLTSSKQNTLAFTLTQSISADTIVALQKDGQTILAFSAPKSFRTIIISSPDLKKNASYSLSTGGNHTGDLTNGLYLNGNYSGGSLITLNNSSTFQLTNTISIFGNSNRR